MPNQAINQLVTNNWTQRS